MVYLFLYCYDVNSNYMYTGFHNVFIHSLMYTVVYRRFITNTAGYMYGYVPRVPYQRYKSIKVVVVNGCYDYRPLDGAAGDSHVTPYPFVYMEACFPVLISLGSTVLLALVPLLY